MHRQGSIQGLQDLEDPFAEVFDCLATNLSGENLKCVHSQAVVGCCLKRILCRSTREIQMQGKIQTEPLPIPALMLQHSHMGPEAQVIDANHIE